MLGLESQTPGGLGQWVFDRGTLTGMSGVMAFVLSANGVWDERDSESLMVALHGELENALGRRLPTALWHQLIRERRATFTCRPNLPRPATQTAMRGLWLAGDYVCAGYPATLEGAVRSGVAAARRILESA
jgi:predicted NAD/FAD-dependent oxidoreductase